ncbi:MAG TPA: NADH-quinone oxidoreductase subunit M [Pirellulaceae bacterium]|nr:NADH-quinone oxidoreductase subunit M [Pirellulaceae bacterium]
MPAWLIATLAVPLVGAVLVSVLSSLGRDVVRWIALATTIVTLLLTGVVVANFPTADEATAEFARYDANQNGAIEAEEVETPDQFASLMRGLDENRDGKLSAAEFTSNYAVTDLPWLGTASGLDIRFSVGLDGLGIYLFGLSALLMVTAVLVSWEAISDRAHLFYAMLLMLEFGCLGVFAARDIMLFYVFFEFTLIPLFFLIGIWGSEDRRYAAVKFFLFTLAGSVLTFLGLLTIVLWHALQDGPNHYLTFSIPTLTAALRETPLPGTLQFWVFLALFAGFAIKVPLFPLHTWLPLAHVQAPTAGSVILAGVLLKIGTYGFARFSIPMLPEATVQCMPWILWLSVGGIIYGALVALAQSDIKRLIAYSSVSHLGYSMLGLFALNSVGLHGGTLQMINHGLSTGGLFALVGMVYERYHTREIAKLGGLARRTPILAFFMIVFTFSSIGLPGLNGFTGEILILLGMFQRAFAETPAVLVDQYKIISVLSVSGVVLGAWYMLYLVQRVFFGPLKEPHEAGAEHHEVRDMNFREICAVLPLTVFVLWIGLHPDLFRQRMEPTLNRITAVTKQPFLDRYNASETASTPAPTDPENFNRVR